jgi:hypothetical protein
VGVDPHHYYFAALIHHGGECGSAVSSLSSCSNLALQRNNQFHPRITSVNYPALRLLHFFLDLARGFDFRNATTRKRVGAPPNFPWH